MIRALFVSLCVCSTAFAALPPDEAALRRAVENRLEALFQEKDVLASDHAVLLASRYRRLLIEPRPAAQRHAELEALLAKCNEPPPQGPQKLDVTRVKDAPLLVDAGDRATLLAAVQWAVEAVRADARATLPFGRRAVRRKDLLASLELFARLVRTSPDPKELARKVAAAFDVYRSPGLAPSGDVLYTAYHEPVFDGRLKPEGVYRYPVYRDPAAAGIPAAKYSSGEIARGALAGKGLELAWLADPLDAFLLGIEGSGMVQLPDGRCLKLEFASKNGHPYRSLGKTLVRMGVLKPWEMSIPAIRQAFRREPGRVREWLDTNPSQVFFKPTMLERVPERMEYTAQRSVACDQGYFPRGGIGFALLERPDVGPDGAIQRWLPHHRYIVNQDTGSAIRGAGHIDLYWGHSPDSGTAAGSMREPGELYYFLKIGTPLVDVRMTSR